MRPETELLFLLARPRIDAETSQRAAVLLDGELDWILLLREALRHDVLPLVYVNLGALGSASVPPSMRNQLAGHFDEHACRNGRLAGELLRLLTVLNRRAIPALALKGPVLAVSAYGDLSFRAFCDLDLLIRRSDAVRAKDVLLGAGYDLFETPLDDRGFPAVPGRFEYMFLGKDGAVAVELHWRLTPVHMRASLDFEYVQARRRTVTLNGTAVPTLTAEDTLLMLCLHGDKHYWRELKWICDVAALVGATPRMRWWQVELDARRLACRRAVAFGLGLASDLLGTSLPPEARHVVRRDARVARLIVQVRRELLRNDQPGSGEDRVRRPYHSLEVLERLSDWTWNGLRLMQCALTVNANDRKILALPKLLWTAYYPLRFVRLLLTYGLRPLIQRLGLKARQRVRN